MLENKRLTIGTLIRTFRGKISLTWCLTLVETALTALVPLFIGFAIDALLEQDLGAFYILAAVLTGLIGISVARRIYDTRVYGTIRVELGCELTGRSARIPVSSQTARLDMGRELVDFLEQEAPEIMTPPLSRRGFLAGSAATLVVPFVVPGVAKAGTETVTLNAYLRIEPDGAVKIISPTSEMGQGTHTGYAAIVADELGIDIDRISVTVAIQPAPEYRLFFGQMRSVGSFGIRA